MDVPSPRIGTIGPKPAAGLAAAPADGGVRIGDFAYRGGRIFLAKTGNSAPLDDRLIAEVATWLAYYTIVRTKAAIDRVRGTHGPSIWFTPDRPHPRYLVRTAALWAGIRVARCADQADAAFFFEDKTGSSPLPARPARGFNFACTDISKSRVAAVFENVFGYPLAVDPRTWRGDAVEKGEENGAHDGRIVRCPRAPRPGRVYQRLVDTVRGDGFAYDLRTHVVAGAPILVWVKRRAPEARFAPPNLAASLQAPDAIFSAAELRLIGRFAAAMGAQWCGLDILRDAASGRIYIVDVNKTDAGPITALPLREKLRSTAILARALRAMIEASASEQPGRAVE